MPQLGITADTRFRNPFAPQGTAAHKPVVHPKKAAPATARHGSTATPTHARRRATGHPRSDTFSPRAGAAPSVGTGGTASGRSLASAARSVAQRMSAPVGGRSQHLCATGVARAVHAATGATVSGNGNTIGNSLLRSGKFHEAKMSLQDALKIPGAVITWQHTPTAKGRIYGHSAVSLGDGHSSASDFIEHNTVASSAGRTGMRVFLPN